MQQRSNLWPPRSFRWRNGLRVRHLTADLDGFGEDGLEDGPVEDGVADADEGDDDVLAEEAGDVRRDLLPEVREEVRDLK